MKRDEIEKAKDIIRDFALCDTDRLMAIEGERAIRFLRELLKARGELTHFEQAERDKE